MKMWRNIVLALLMLDSTLQTSAQENSGNNASATRNGRDVVADTSFIRKNIRDNTHEIRMAELAISRDLPQEIKNIAITIRDDHKAMLNDLLTYTKEANLTSITEGEMNISSDTVGHGNASSGNTGIMTRNRREDAQSVNESRNKASQRKATQQADAGKPVDDKRGTGFDNSRERQANSDSGAAADAGITATSPNDEASHQRQMSELENLNGKEFSSLWVQQMINAHEAKLSELEAASRSLQNGTLKRQASAAIPKVKRHLELLKQVKS
jgi:predicted outer membrane protein